MKSETLVIKSFCDQKKYLEAKKRFDLLDIPETISDDIVYSVTGVLQCFQNYKEFFCLDDVRDIVIKICSYEPTEMYCVKAQLQLLYLYFSLRNYKKQDKSFTKIRKEDISVLLHIWERCEKGARPKPEEIEIPKDFFDNSRPYTLVT